MRTSRLRLPRTPHGRTRGASDTTARVLPLHTSIHPHGAFTTSWRARGLCDPKGSPLRPRNAHRVEQRTARPLTAQIAISGVILAFPEPSNMRSPPRRRIGRSTTRPRVRPIGLPSGTIGTSAASPPIVAAAVPPPPVDCGIAGPNLIQPCGSVGRLVSSRSTAHASHRNSVPHAHVLLAASTAPCAQANLTHIIRGHRRLSRRGNEPRWDGDTPRTGSCGARPRGRPRAPGSRQRWCRRPFWWGVSSGGGRRDTRPRATQSVGQAMQVSVKEAS